MIREVATTLRANAGIPLCILAILNIVISVWWYLRRKKELRELDEAYEGIRQEVDRLVREKLDRLGRERKTGAAEASQ